MHAEVFIGRLKCCYNYSSGFLESLVGYGKGPRQVRPKMQTITPNRRLTGAYSQSVLSEAGPIKNVDLCINIAFNRVAAVLVLVVHETR